MEVGVYTITSPSGGQYVGSAVNILRRWSTHRRQLRDGVHHSVLLQRAADKYGIDALQFDRFISCMSKSDLIRYEQIALDDLRPAYNVCKVAGSKLGVVPSAETRAKIAKSHTGKRLTPEHRAKIAAAGIGRRHTEQFKADTSRRHKGKTVSAEAREKLRAANVGKRASDETRAKMSATRKGVKKPPASLAGMLASNEARKGVPISDELRKKISEARKGKGLGRVIPQEEIERRRETFKRTIEARRSAVKT